MLSKADQAIKENILKPQTVETFFKHVYIRKADDAIIADSHEEFMKQINDPCHIWQGYKSDRGYGWFTLYSKEGSFIAKVKAHRFAFAYHYGFDALPAGVEGGKRNVINHLCHNTSCVNPLHLESITHQQNCSPEKRKPVNV